MRALVKIDLIEKKSVKSQAITLPHLSPPPTSPLPPPPPPLSTNLLGL